MSHYWPGVHCDYIQTSFYYLGVDAFHIFWIVTQRYMKTNLQQDLCLDSIEPESGVYP